MLDAALGRSGNVYKAWLTAQPEGFIDGVEHAALDPFRGYANAIRDRLPDAVAVLDAFHVVRLGTQVVDEVRRRVQQDTLGRRGHKHDPLYKIRGLLRHGVEHLTDKQQAKISACLDASDPTDEVNLTWQCYQQLRSIYHAAPAKGREIAIKVLDSFHNCPIPEVARLGRTLRGWRAQVLAYFDTSGVSNGGTEAIQPDHRESPPTGPRLQRFRSLQTPNHARRQRPKAVPKSTSPCLNPKTPAFLIQRGMPTVVTPITHEHIEHFLADMFERITQRPWPSSPVHTSRLHAERPRRHRNDSRPGSRSL